MTFRLRYRIEKFVLQKGSAKKVVNKTIQYHITTIQ